MTRKEKIHALKQSVLFQNLTQDALESIVQKVKFRQYFAEETIVWQGNPSDSLYLIINGIVAIKKNLGAGQTQTLAYVMQGSSFGEVGILENRPRSANVDAVSDVDLLVLQRKDFMEILYQFPEVAIELARMLGQYLTASNRRQSRKSDKAKVILIFDTFEGGGATSIGVLLAHILRQKSRYNTVYTEYPNAHILASEFHLDKKTKIYRHPSGYDIWVDFENDTIKTSHILDKLMKDYDNIVINAKKILQKGFDEDLVMMLDYADQIIVIVPPDQENWKKFETFKEHIRRHLNIEEASILSILNRSNEVFQNSEFKEKYDIEIPFFENFPSMHELVKTSPEIPEKLNEILETIVDRLDRTNQIAIFIPTTVDVDQQIDTSHYVKLSLDFLAERFGGATSREAQGVWNSQEVGLVGEKVYIVNTFVTQVALNQHLDEVIDFVKQLKSDLSQEAMALEVNGKLTLI